jgi:hypothetical protein
MSYERTRERYVYQHSSTNHLFAICTATRNDMRALDAYLKTAIAHTRRREKKNDDLLPIVLEEMNAALAVTTADNHGVLKKVFWIIMTLFYDEDFFELLTCNLGAEQKKSATEVQMRMREGADLYLAPPTVQYYANRHHYTTDMMLMGGIILGPTYHHTRPA